jgi:UDP-N-acetylglucosamine/UDP-N-acetylgalactosamine diphosphorylase
MVGQREYEQARGLLAEHHQEHILTFWPELNSDQKEHLLGQIRDLDWPRICGAVEALIKHSPGGLVRKLDFEPAASYSPRPRNDRERDKYAEAVRVGNNLISAGKVAALLVAGGQGTRLAFEGPKGNYPISPYKHKTFFRIFAETMATVSRRHQTTCPWYVMTSPMNHAETVRVFESNQFYGLDPENVFIFRQGTLPNFDRDGRILLAGKADIALSPDGHGGCIKALHHSGALADMRDRGIEYLSYWQVDNPLVRLFDPLFIGLHAMDGAQMSSKAVIKNGPKEKVGNFCLVDGKMTVIEYSDLPETLAEKQNPDGSLVFGLGSIAIHIISTSFVEQLNPEACSLPLHRADKKIRHVDMQGNLIDPPEPNGIKLESFIFDALPLTEKSIILEIERAEQFGPTKNRTGPDSVNTTREMMIARAAKWLEAAGIEIPRTPAGAPDCILEIAPTFALDPDDIRGRRDQVPLIQRGDKVYLA